MQLQHSTWYLGSRIKDGDWNRVSSRLKQLKIKTRDMTIDKYSISFEAKSRS